MACAGFPADTYDRYVLGLLEEPDRSQLETQIQEQCPTCIQGVQRSMNLWLVFATTLENAEPSADFRGRLVRIAELSRKVLTFPKSAALRDRTTILTSTLIMIAAVLAVLLLATWYAGRQSIKLDMQQPVSASLNALAEKVANSQLELKRQKEARQLDKSLSPAGRLAINQVNKLQEQLSESQAEAQQYKAINERNLLELAEQTRLVAALTSPGARLLTLKGTEGAETADTTAYALLVENSKLVLVASNLPELAAGRTFQLWIIRKEAPKFVSAGVFAADANAPSLVHFEQGALLSSVAGLAVTEEPTGGSSEPSATKILEANAGSED